MKITIEIPKEFECDFINNRFEDAFQRLMSDAHCIAGNYEKETASMLINAFKNSKEYNLENAIRELEERKQLHKRLIGYEQTMGRLIDEDVLMADVRNTITEKSGAMDWINLINCQPTAYDPDKVVKQLEELKSLVPVNRVLDDIINEKPKELGMLIAYRKAIEIVKGGGISKDEKDEDLER